MKTRTAALFTLLLLFGVAYGYIHNLYLLTQTDFKEPYKAEVLRGAGVFIPPLGIIEGYFDIADGGEHHD